MFIRLSKSGYNRAGGAFVHGQFLVLCQREHGPSNRTDNPIRAFTCYARMSQCGHFMMARVRRQGRTLTLSGAYGNDGLTCDVPDVIYDAAIPLPDPLAEEWATNTEGRHGAGSEGRLISEWALDAFPAPRRNVNRRR